MSCRYISELCEYCEDQMATDGKVMWCCNKECVGSDHRHMTIVTKLKNLNTEYQNKMFDNFNVAAKAIETANEKIKQLEATVKELESQKHCMSTEEKYPECPKCRWEYDKIIQKNKRLTEALSRTCPFDCNDGMECIFCEGDGNSITPHEDNCEYIKLTGGGHPG